MEAKSGRFLSSNGGKNEKNAEISSIFRYKSAVSRRRFLVVKCSYSVGLPIFMPRENRKFESERADVRKF